MLLSSGLPNLTLKLPKGLPTLYAKDITEIHTISYKPGWSLSIPVPKEGQTAHIFSAEDPENPVSLQKLVRIAKAVLDQTGEVKDIDGIKIITSKKAHNKELKTSFFSIDSSGNLLYGKKHSKIAKFSPGYFNNPKESLKRLSRTSKLAKMSKDGVLYIDSGKLAALDLKVYVAFYPSTEFNAKADSSVIELVSIKEPGQQEKLQILPVTSSSSYSQNNSLIQSSSGISGTTYSSPIEPPSFSDSSTTSSLSAEFDSSSWNSENGDSVSSETATSSESSSSASFFVSYTNSAPSQDCYLCIWDEGDINAKRICDLKAKVARDKGKNPVTVISNVLLLLDQQELCKCKNIDYFEAVHGVPGEESKPFVLAKKIKDLAPKCENINIENLNCSRFDSSNKALEAAEKLSIDMAKSGYEGTITITGNQTMAFAVSPMFSIMDDLSNKELRLLVKMINEETGEEITKKEMKQIIAEEFEKSNKICESYSTPLSFQVCAAIRNKPRVGIKLSPCKQEDDISLLDRPNKATTTIACAEDGKWANQSCQYVGSKSCSCFDPECDYCKCKWGKPELCNK